MLEIVGDIWDLEKDYDAVIITTNGSLNSKGEAIIGSGIALEARERFDWFAGNLGNQIKFRGNHVFEFNLVPASERANSEFDKSIFSFPTKHNWQGISDYGLIVRSCFELLNEVDWRGPDYKVLMPRPGVGAGKLPWVTVKEMIRLVLDDRFTVATHSVVAPIR